MSQNEDFRITSGDYAEGDMIKQKAGRDMKGVAAGREASVEYSETVVTAVLDVATLKSFIEELQRLVEWGDIRWLRVM